MNVEVQCPYCDKKYDLEDSMVGRKVRCGKCKEQFSRQNILVDHQWLNAGHIVGMCRHVYGSR
jgi:predicted Zn finger-like uncharacterized protein